MLVTKNTILEVGKPVEVTVHNLDAILEQLDYHFSRNPKLVVTTSEGTEFPFTPKIEKEYYERENGYFEIDDDEDVETEDYGDIYDEELSADEQMLLIIFDKYDDELSYVICENDKITLEEDCISISLNQGQEYVKINFKSATDEQITDHIANALVNNIDENINESSDNYFFYFLARNQILQQLRETVKKEIRKRRLVTGIETEYGRFLFKINPVEFVTFGSETKKLFSLQVEEAHFENCVRITNENYQQVAESLRNLFSEGTEYGILSNTDVEFHPFTPIVDLIQDEEGFDITIQDKYSNTEIILTQDDWIKGISDDGILIHSEMPEDEDGEKYSPETFLIVPKNFSEEEKYEQIDETLTERIAEILEKDYTSEDVDNILDSLDIVSYLSGEEKENKPYSVYAELENGQEVLVTVNVREFKKNGMSAENLVTVNPVETQQAGE